MIKCKPWTALIILHLLVIVTILLRVPNNDIINNNNNHFSSTRFYHSTETDEVASHFVDTDSPENGVHDNDDEDPGQSRILMIHYHKTGFVLSRQLRSLAEHNLVRVNTTHEEYNNSTIFHIPEKKNWGSIQQPRKFNQSTNCPEIYHLEGGYIHVQESPDLYCHIEKLADVILHDEDIQTSRQTKIIHFVRNPYSMVLSNYFYHRQDPTPEPWVTTHHPCELEYVDSNLTLKDLLFPTLSEAGIMSAEDFDRISNICRSLYQTSPKLKTQYFEGHLRQLVPIDGLRLSTSQMMIRGGGKILIPGGDLLRMANTIIKLRELQRYYLAKNNGKNNRHHLSVITVSMDDFISNPEAFTEMYLQFLLGRSRYICPEEDCPRKIRMIAKSFAKQYSKMKEKGSSHVTSGTQTDTDRMRNELKYDPNFGPILDEIERLVDEELHDSNTYFG